MRNGCSGTSKRKIGKFPIVYWTLMRAPNIRYWKPMIIFHLLYSILPISIENIWFNDDAYHKLRVAPYEIRLICFGAFSPCSRDGKWFVKSIIIRPLHLSNGACDRVSVWSRGLRGKFPIIYYYLLNSIASRVSRMCRRRCAECAEDRSENPSRCRCHCTQQKCIEIEVFPISNPYTVSTQWMIHNKKLK